VAAHPLQQLLSWFPDRDFAVLDHGFLPHGRDYSMVLESQLGKDPGRHRVQFTHTAVATYVTAVSDELWQKSWSDTFVDYVAWERAGTPPGYIWGTNWSLAEGGIKAVEPSPLGEMWTERLGKPMYEVRLETDRFSLVLVFHSLRTAKIDDRTDTISQVIAPVEE
jgi:hypothetical protein